MSRYAIVIETTDTGYSAYAPDLPGCVAVADTREDIEREMADAIEFHLEGHRAEGLPIPPATTSTACVEAAAA